VPYEIANLSRDSMLADCIHLAGTSQDRRTGLLHHEDLPPGSGLWIDPCEAIHTFQMKFAIDVAFLDRKHRVIKVRKDVGPRRICLCLHASSVLELPVGAIAISRTEPGDLLEIRASTPKALPAR
jgi:uncharacterized membrane protein (UPF0127 family)